MISPIPDVWLCRNGNQNGLETIFRLLSICFSLYSAAFFNLKSRFSLCCIGIRNSCYCYTQVMSFSPFILFIYTFVSNTISQNKKYLLSQCAGVYTGEPTKNPDDREDFRLIPLAHLCLYLSTKNGENLSTMLP